MTIENKAHKLNEMAGKGYNVARFISVSKNKPEEIEYNWSTPKGEVGGTIRKGVEELIKHSRDGSVNVRSFSEEKLEGNRFEMCKTDVEEIIKIIDENTKEGRHSIVNENIDVADGGVSGVILRQGEEGVIEFSPEDTPRCVEKPGVCSLPQKYGIEIIKKVYGIDLEEIVKKVEQREKEEGVTNVRIEFSIHPLREGLYKEHTIVWEVKDQGEAYKVGCVSKTEYPNNFSKYIGDKAYGLVLAEVLGIRVPKTTVIGRNVAPFNIGQDTGEKETWVRTAPVEKEAGKYYTGKGWVDPFKMMQEEESKGAEGVNDIASILSQQAVEADYSGGGIVRKEKKESIIEGVKGEGDTFMVGENNKAEIPPNIQTGVELLEDKIREYHDLLGDMTYEWVQDTKGYVWLVQMNQITEKYTGRDIIVAGDVEEYIEYTQEEGIEKLRELVENIDRTKVGVKVKGNIGLTSHIGDVLRRANIVSRIVGL